jgi:hypothetical protein
LAAPLRLRLRCQFHRTLRSRRWWYLHKGC